MWRRSEELDLEGFDRLLRPGRFVLQMRAPERTLWKPRLTKLLERLCAATDIYGLRSSADFAFFTHRRKVDPCPPNSWRLILYYPCAYAC